MMVRQDTQFRKRILDTISDSVVPCPREELETPTFGFVGPDDVLERRLDNVVVGSSAP